MSHKRRNPPKGRCRGFTLLEVIVIVIVMGLLAALTLNLMGTQLLRSSNPATIAAEAADAEADMEAVLANFNNRVNDDATFADLDGLKADYTGNGTVSIVDNNNWNGDGVRALVVTTTVGGTSYTTLLPQTRTNAADSKVDF
jgi:prepilin-type N-terminal cleavage/methylation domain-containing protein